jgi:hypothetical protein
MNLIEDYQPLIKSQAIIFEQKYPVDKNDLEQEGNLMLHQIQEAGNLGDNPLAVSSYVKLRVIGAMRDYIAKNVGPVAVPKSAFWEHGERAGVGDFEEIGDSINLEDPETLYLKKESDKIFNKKVIAFVKDLSLQEEIVWLLRIYCDEPSATRQVAEFIGVKSPQTVLNIEERVKEKAKGVFDNAV